LGESGAAGEACRDGGEDRLATGEKQHGDLLRSLEHDAEKCERFSDDIML
jgi:hypothetical protein